MGCNQSVGDKYERCEFLLDEYKLILIQNSIKDFSDKELKYIQLFKEEKKTEIQRLITEIESRELTIIQSKKLKQIKSEFQQLNDDEDSNNYSTSNLSNE